jgi:hypothetical protein
LSSLVAVYLVFQIFSYVGLSDKIHATEQSSASNFSVVKKTEETNFVAREVHKFLSYK